MMEANKKNFIEPITVADSKRYGEKLTYKGRRLLDPYYEVASEKWSRELVSLPCVTFPDIFCYCVMKTGFYTNQQLKAYRSLEAHNYFENGFVQELLTARACDDAVFIKAKVLPSQRVGQKAQPYSAWILCTAMGEVISAHCTCMAG